MERRVGDWAVAAVGVALWLDGDTVVDAGIGLTAVGAPHFHAPEAEEALRDGPATPETFAGRPARSPASTADRRPTSAAPPTTSGTWLRELTTRALRRAAARARGEEG